MRSDQSSIAYSLFHIHREFYAKLKEFEDEPDCIGDIFVQSVSYENRELKQGRRQQQRQRQKTMI